MFKIFIRNLYIRITVRIIIKILPTMSKTKIIQSQQNSLKFFRENTTDYNLGMNAEYTIVVNKL